MPIRQTIRYTCFGGNHLAHGFITALDGTQLASCEECAGYIGKRLAVPEKTKKLRAQCSHCDKTYVIEESDSDQPATYCSVSCEESEV